MKNKIKMSLVVTFLILILFVSNFSVAKVITKNDLENVIISRNYGFNAEGMDFNDSSVMPVSTDNYVFPSSFDWRDVAGYDFTTSIKDQGYCGSCYAFAAVASLESVIKIEKNNPNFDIDLSEQYVVSCCRRECYGCDGGVGSKVFDWMCSSSYGDNAGAIVEDCFEYSGIDYKGYNGIDEDNDPVSCSDKCENWKEYKFEVEKTIDIGSGIYNIKKNLLKYGPISATMVASDDFALDYEDGVYVNKNLNNYNPNHQVLIVGYQDTERSLLKPYDGYWICKNSWGTQWGENGYFKIAYGCARIDSGGDYSVPVYNDDSALQPSLYVSTNSLSFPRFKNTKTFTIKNNGEAGSKMVWHAKTPTKENLVQRINPSSGILEKGESQQVTVEIDGGIINTGHIGSIDIITFKGESEENIRFVKLNSKFRFLDLLDIFNEIFPIIKQNFF